MQKLAAIHMGKVIYFASVCSLAHLQTELQSGLQVGSQIFGCCVCNFHQRLEHRVISLVARLIHCLIKQKPGLVLQIHSLSSGMLLMLNLHHHHESLTRYSLNTVAMEFSKDAETFIAVVG